MSESKKGDAVSHRGGCVEGFRRLAWFTLSIAVVSLAISVLVHGWVKLPWWSVFRRCVSISAALVLVGLVPRFQGQSSLRSLGLGGWREGKRHFAQGLGLGCGAILALGAVLLAMGICRVSVTSDQLHVLGVLLGFIPAACLIGLLEELVFRGYVLQQLLACSKPLAVVGSSAAYALVHLKPQAVWPNSGFELVGLFLLGWVLARSVLSTKQLYLAIGLHAGLAYWVVVNKLVIEFTTPSLRWLVGTNRLVNGALEWGMLIGLGWIVARWKDPRQTLG